jgi:hypothetical protein
MISGFAQAESPPNRPIRSSASSRTPQRLFAAQNGGSGVSADDLPHCILMAAPCRDGLAYGFIDGIRLVAANGQTEIEHGLFVDRLHATFSLTGLSEHFCDDQSSRQDRAFRASRI